MSADASDPAPGANASGLSRAAALEGLRAAAPFMPTIAPFGIVAALTALEAGFSPWQVMASSTVIFAGASQIAVAGLLGDGAALVVVVLTAWVINLRMAMYSATLAPVYGKARLGHRLLVAYALTDQAFVIGHKDHQARPERPIGEAVSHYLAAGFSIWLLWLACTALGILLKDIPQIAQWLTRIPLDFAVPLVFLAVLVPLLRDRPSLVAAAVGGCVASVGLMLPLKLGILAGAISGIAAGLAAESWIGWRRRRGFAEDDPPP